MKKISLIKSKKFVIYAKKYLVLMMIRELHSIKSIIKYHCHYAGKYRGVAHNICNLRYKTPKEIPVVFHNGSTYDYHFIINELAKKFEGKFECLGESSEKHITFNLLIKSLIMVNQLNIK